MTTKIKNRESINTAKTEVKYRVGMGYGDYWYHRTWKSAVNFANKIGQEFIIIEAKKGNKECELCYKVNTWKNAKQIAFDIECELF